MSHDHPVDQAGLFLQMWTQVGELLRALHEHDKDAFHQACKGVLLQANFCGFCGEALA